MATTLEEDLKERVMDLIRKLPGLSAERRQLILGELANPATVISNKQLKIKMHAFLKCVMIFGDVPGNPSKIADDFIQSCAEKRKIHPADSSKKTRPSKKGKH